MPKVKADQPKPGMVRMMLKPPDRANYDIENVKGFVLGQWGVARNPYNEDLWSVTYLKTGMALRTSILKKKDAIDLMQRVASAVEDRDISNLDPKGELAAALREIVMKWAYNL